MLRKTLENKNFIRPALLCANIHQIFFSHLDTLKYLLLFFQESVQMVPSLYHILQQGCQNSNWFLYCWDGVSTRTQIFERKWNCQNMFTQIFLSEIISIAENGGQGTHFLISQILKGLTHCAMYVWHTYDIFLTAKTSKWARLMERRPTVATSAATQSSKLFNLKAHMLAHSGVKPCVSKQCNFSFTQAGDLKTHIITHSGEKPFSCQQCEFSFTTVSNLKKHT